MKRLKSILLLLVSLVLLTNNSLAEEMTYEEVVEMSKIMTQTKMDFSTYLEDWNFSAIIEYVSSPECRIPEEIVENVLQKANEANDILSGCLLEYDPFTNETKVVSKLLLSFAEDCCVFPYLDGTSLCLIVGFQYEESFLYDKIYVKSGDDIHYFEFVDDFEIEFDRLRGEQWEYSFISTYGFKGDTVDAISFRKEGSVLKYDYVLSDTEKEAIQQLNKLYILSDEIHDAIFGWKI